MVKICTFKKTYEHLNYARKFNKPIKKKSNIYNRNVIVSV